MDKTTSITLQTAGPTVLIGVLAQIAVKVAERYHIIIAPETMIALIIGISFWWTHRHTKKTAALIDVLANSDEKMTVDAGKALAKIATEVQSNGLAGPIDDQTVALAKDVAKAREFNPQTTVQDVIERTQNR
jgi:hypothetical protein